MTPDEFLDWRKHMGSGKPISFTKVAELLGITDATASRYQKGEATIPKHVALACVAAALPGWVRPPWAEAGTQ